MVHQAQNSTQILSSIPTTALTSVFKKKLVRLTEELMDPYSNFHEITSLVPVKNSSTYQVDQYILF